MFGQRVDHAHYYTPTLRATLTLPRRAAICIIPANLGAYTIHQRWSMNSLHIITHKLWVITEWQDQKIFFLHTLTHTLQHLSFNVWKKSYCFSVTNAGSHCWLISDSILDSQVVKRKLVCKYWCVHPYQYASPAHVFFTGLVSGGFTCSRWGAHHKVNSG